MTYRAPVREAGLRAACYAKAMSLRRVVMDRLHVMRCVALMGMMTTARVWGAGVGFGGGGHRGVGRGVRGTGNGDRTGNGERRS